ncbi:MAG TPA: hypothetical protein VLJ15_07370 [Gammaproteobacteria bacterium]|nr:hypothetical protein [Gammaproteobacteria bacterium]
MHSHALSDDEILKLKESLLRKYGPDLSARLVAIQEYLKNIDIFDSDEDRRIYNQLLALHAISAYLVLCLNTLKTKNLSLHPLESMYPEVELSGFIGMIDKEHPYIIEEISRNPQKYVSILNPPENTSTQQPASPEMAETKSPAMHPADPNEQQAIFTRNMLALKQKYEEKISGCLEKIESLRLLCISPEELHTYINLFKSLQDRWQKNEWEHFDPSRMNESFINQQYVQFDVDIKTFITDLNKKREGWRTGDMTQYAHYDTRELKKILQQKVVQLEEIKKHVTIRLPTVFNKFWNNNFHEVLFDYNDFIINLAEKEKYYKFVLQDKSDAKHDNLRNELRLLDVMLATIPELAETYRKKMEPEAIKTRSRQIREELIDRYSNPLVERIFALDEHLKTKKLLPNDKKIFNAYFLLLCDYFERIHTREPFQSISSVDGSSHRNEPELTDENRMRSVEYLIETMDIYCKRLETFEPREPEVQIHLSADSELPPDPDTLLREKRIANVKKLLQITEIEKLLSGGYRDKLKNFIKEIDQSPYPNLLESYKNLFHAILKKDRAIILSKKIDANYLNEKIEALNDDLKNQMDATEKARKAFISQHKESQTGFAWFKKSDIDYKSSLAEIIKHANAKNNPSYLTCKQLGWLDSSGNVLSAEKIANKYELEGGLQLRTMAMKRGSDEK